MLEYIVARMVERSAWQGLVTLLTGMGSFHLSGHPSTDALSLGAMLAGVIGFILPEKLNACTEDEEDKKDATN